MFRAALLSIVLTLAAGQNVALLCGTWCHSSARPAGTCEHYTPAPPARVGATEDCAVSSNAVVFVQEDGRRSAPAPDVAAAVRAARSALAPRPAGILSAWEPDRRLLLERRPLVLALRI